MQHKVTTVAELEHDEHEGLDEASLLEHEEITKVKNVANVLFGKYIMECWYFSPFPKVSLYTIQCVRTYVLSSLCHCPQSSARSLSSHSSWRFSFSKIFILDHSSLLLPLFPSSPMLYSSVLLSCLLQSAAVILLYHVPSSLSLHSSPFHHIYLYSNNSSYHFTFLLLPSSNFSSFSFLSFCLIQYSPFPFLLHFLSTFNTPFSARCLLSSLLASPFPLSFLCFSHLSFLSLFFHPTPSFSFFLFLYLIIALSHTPFFSSSFSIFSF